MPRINSSFDTCSLDKIESATEYRDGSVIGHFKGLIVSSHFQPIFSLTHKRPVGYEALLRAKNSAGDDIPPLMVFNMRLSERETVYLDRLCRNLHLRNFLTMPDNNRWLFLNINPLVMVKGSLYGSYFSELLSRYQIPAHRLVVEILESSIQDESLLANAVNYYRELGCLIAIDDFGAGHSNFDRIWDLSPQIVKLDRTIINHAANNQYAKHILPNLVNLIHESGSLCLMEGVETEQEAIITMDADIDFVQGYYFGKPACPALSYTLDSPFLTQLSDKFRNFAQNEATQYHAKLRDFIVLFQTAANLIAAGTRLAEACYVLINQQSARRCFLLNDQGLQLGININPEATSIVREDPRFEPIADTKDANWSRRHYFRRAINNPEEVQISRPYLSITGANMCVTISIKIMVGSLPQVLCCDLDWDENDIKS